MKIINTQKRDCIKCGPDVDHFLSVVLNKWLCTQCWRETPTKPDDFMNPKPEMVVMHSGGPERNV